MQIEFDDTLWPSLTASKYCGTRWTTTSTQTSGALSAGVDFALTALEQDGSKLLIHCAAGVHRAPMMALAVLRALGWEADQACNLIQTRRYAADFADVYVRSVEAFMRSYAAAQK
jgi:protein-tyrosine phosphatase